MLYSLNTIKPLQVVVFRPDKHKKCGEIQHLPLTIVDGKYLIEGCLIKAFLIYFSFILIYLNLF